MDKAERIQRAFLRYVQTENLGCEVTGFPCREPSECSCWGELVSFVLATPEDASAQ